MNGEFAESAIRFAVGLGITLLGVWLTAWLLAPSEGTLGRRELRFGSRTRGIAYASLAFAGIAGYAAYNEIGTGLWAAWILAGVFGAAGIYLLLETYTRRITYNEQGLRDHSIWRGDREMTWDALAGYSYSELNHWHVLDFGRHGKVRVSILLEGATDFESFLRRMLFGT